MLNNSNKGKNTMTDVELRLECIRLSLHYNGLDVIEDAKKIYEFVVDGEDE